MVELQNQLREHVEMIAGQIGIRSLLTHPEKLDQARDYIEGVWQDQGYEVQKQPFSVRGITHPTANLEVVKPGSKQPEQSIVIGAHYDSTPHTPGADDNASGVAALLAISQSLHDIETSKTLRFVAFSTEEPPFFNTPEMGSWKYAKNARQNGLDIKLMLALEMLGCYSEKHNSQRLPYHLNLIYPDTADYITVVGNLRSAFTVDRVVREFNRVSEITARRVILPQRVYGVTLSDHANFWRAGYPAVMVTDTAFLRNHHYHSETDTPDTLNYEYFAKTVDGLIRLTPILANS